MHKRPLVDREPLTAGSTGTWACWATPAIPMTPYMAQGAAMAIEDAAILSRCLDGARPRRVPARCGATRPRGRRTARMQLTSRENRWGKGETDTDWVYGYNAWTAPLSDAGS